MFDYLNQVINKDSNVSCSNFCGVELTTVIAFSILLIAISTVFFHQPHDTALGLLLGTNLLHNIWGKRD